MCILFRIFAVTQFMNVKCYRWYCLSYPRDLPIELNKFSIESISSIDWWGIRNMDIQSLESRYEFEFPVHLSESFWWSNLDLFDYSCQLVWLGSENKMVYAEYEVEFTIEIHRLNPWEQKESNVRISSCLEVNNSCEKFAMKKSNNWDFLWSLFNRLDRVVFTQICFQYCVRSTYINTADKS